MIVEGLFQGNIFRPSIVNIFSYTRVNLNFSSEWCLLLTNSNVCEIALAITKLKYCSRYGINNLNIAPFWSN